MHPSLDDMIKQENVREIHVIMMMGNTVSCLI